MYQCHLNLDLYIVRYISFLETPELAILKENAEDHQLHSNYKCYIQYLR